MVDYMEIRKNISKTMVKIRKEAKKILRKSCREKRLFPVPRTLICFTVQHPFHTLLTKV